MMNRVVIALILLFGNALGLFANPINIEMAKRVAQNFMGKSRSASKSVSDVVVEKWEEQTSIYIINFCEGGWVMVSADDAAIPVLAFSDNGVYRVEDEKPGGFLFLVSDYIAQIDTVRKMKPARSTEVVEMWNSLTADNGRTGGAISQKSGIFDPPYNPGDLLLDDPARGGYIEWGQDDNNSGPDHCDPSYNSEIKKKLIHGWFADCNCDAPPVGCGAVAIGQVMWYWKWPQSSVYRTYNWNLMPNELIDSTSAAEAKEVAQLLLDCGEASNMTYACAGSFTIGLESALKHTFGYSATKKVRRNSMSSNGWNIMIRFEINSKQPVIMYGDEGLLSSIKHYFIVDGYCDPLDTLHTGHFNHFHINFGFKGDSNGFFYLGNIYDSDGYTYNNNQYALVDIFPNPILNGPSTVCRNGGFFSLYPRPAKAVTWSVTGPFTVSDALGGIRVTRTGTSNSSGTLTATMNGGVIASKTITPCPTPTISGFTPFEWSQSFSLHDMPPGTTSVNWNVTGNYVLSNQTNSSVTVTRTGTSPTSGVLTATANGVSATKQISSTALNFSFSPSNWTVYVDDGYVARIDFYATSGVLPGNSNYDYRIDAYHDDANGEWELFDQVYYCDFPSYFDADLSLITPSEPEYWIRLVGYHIPTNRSYDLDHITVYCNHCSSLYSAYPNPATNILNVAIAAQAAAQSKSTGIKQTPAYDIRLYDGQGTLLRNAKTKGGTIQFNVANLTNGVYYLHIYDGVNAKPEIRQIVVEH